MTKTINLFLFLIVILLLNGCESTQHTYVRQNLWEFASPSSSKEFHLVLVWKETHNKISSNGTQPEEFIDLFAKECNRRGLGRLRSYQIVETSDDLETWAPFWNPNVPTLRIDAHFMVEESTSEWKTDFQILTNYQPFVFDISPHGNPYHTVIKEDVFPKENIESKDYEERKREIQRYLRWFKEIELQIYQQSINGLISDPELFAKSLTSVKIYSGKSEGMKKAYEAAKKKKWANAKEIWLKELEITRDDPILNLNLAACSQMLGEWDQALDYYEKYSAYKPQGFVWLFSGLPIEKDNVRMLKGLSLTIKNLKKQNRYNPNATIAILLLENITNNIDTPMRIREELLKESNLLGIRTLSLGSVDEKLRLNGFTDAGQFPSTTAQSLGKIVGSDLVIKGEISGFSSSNLSLVYAPSGETIFTKHVSGMMNLGRQFFRPWPRYYSQK